MADEVFRKIPGWNYVVSSQGTIYSLNNGYIVIGKLDRYNRPVVLLHDPDTHKHKYFTLSRVYRMVNDDKRKSWVKKDLKNEYLGYFRKGCDT